MNNSQNGLSYLSLKMFLHFCKDLNTLCLILFLLINHTANGILFPQDSETRETKSLDGVWNFRIVPRLDQNIGFRENWFLKPLLETGDVIPMPVPSSYNDITQNVTIRDHVGWAWYDKSFFVPVSWQNQKWRIVLRIGSAHYFTHVWLNGMNVLNHEGGHLPFETDITNVLKYSTNNLITIAVNNTLTPETIPQGQVVFQNDSSKYPPGYFTQTYTFDFLNYAGIHRSVLLYSTPKTYIDDITVTTDILNDTMGVLYYNVVSKEDHNLLKTNSACVLELINKVGETVSSQTSCKGKMSVSNAQLWWPYTLSETPGYLYILKIQLQSNDVTDVYRLKIGFRTVAWNNTTFRINNKPFYFRGFGKHEDSDIRGKGLDIPLIIKDFNLIKWIGANAFRTSHYPYADEILDRADEEGIVLIDECPGVNLDNFDDNLLQKHKRVMQELIQRDKNHPSVIMWSVGNEARTQRKAAGPYFQKIIQYVKQLDPIRPVTLVLNVDMNKDNAAPFLDIICVNRYFGWYSDTGHLELITQQVFNEFTSWHKKYNKPLLITEYGADTVSGLNMDPPFIFTEDYQVAYLIEHFKGFDKLQREGFFIGEMIWNFADFMTKQEINRVVGNKKGIFTRQRQPKPSAHTLRIRYWQLAQRLNKYTTNKIVHDFFSPVCSNM